MRFSQFPFITILVLFMSNFDATYCQSPLPNGHAHNDYEHERPLLDALDLGYSSIEVDIHFYKKSLRVSHDDHDLESKPTLDELYLQPLKELIQKNDGRIFKNDSTSLILMIDFKTKKKRALQLLSNKLDKYNDLLTKQFRSYKQWAPIQIILSGDPPLQKLNRLNRTYFYIDGRFEMAYPANLEKMVARMSANINDIESIASQNDRSKALAKLVSEAKLNKRKIRFWATEDNPRTWIHLLEHGVDWISVDDLKGFAKFRETYSKHNQDR